MTPKETLEMLKNICRNCLENEPSDPTEREIGYSAAMEHIVQIIDKQTNKVEKQTAVEWLIDQVEDYIGLIPTDIIEQAKEMEKQSLEKFYEFGINDGYNDSFEQHYNETFKNK